MYEGGEERRRLREGEGTENEGRRGLLTSTDFAECYTFIDQAIQEESGNVYVHCWRGISRYKQRTSKVERKRKSFRNPQLLYPKISEI
jgi:hypothetical protein